MKLAWSCTAVALRIMMNISKERQEENPRLCGSKSEDVGGSQELYPFLLFKKTNTGKAQGFRKKMSGRCGSHLQGIHYSRA